ncbi:LAME_0H06524g1_1 [Lachancea meyersii CBS 8951]|uniref:LAME_0H06524g1_1 n=1 Tax=Lachancea meyersii CBS 8951 TaxID=1266667 RepID=A0A1G4KEL0_9SACH|nr:LAME_0H06524g1_1 [Lachancea meyersii CBS 8951]
MTSVEYRLSAEDPDLLFQFSSPLARNTESGGGGGGGTRPATTKTTRAATTTQSWDFQFSNGGGGEYSHVRGGHVLSTSAASTLLEDNDDDEAQTLFGSVNEGNQNGAVTAPAPAPATALATAPAPAPPAASLRGNSSQHVRVAPRDTHRVPALGSSAHRTAPRRPSGVHTLSQFNNILTRSLSAHQLQDIERMVDEFWLRDSKLTEDMFDDSSDEEA